MSYPGSFSEENTDGNDLYSAPGDSDFADEFQDEDERYDSLSQQVEDLVYDTFGENIPDDEKEQLANSLAGILRRYETRLNRRLETTNYGYFNPIQSRRPAPQINLVLLGPSIPNNNFPIANNIGFQQPNQVLPQAPYMNPYSPYPMQPQLPQPNYLAPGQIPQPYMPPVVEDKHKKVKKDDKNLKNENIDKKVKK